MKVADAKARARDRALVISSLVLEGRRSTAIGCELGIAGARVRVIAKDFGIKLPGSQTLRLAFYTKRRRGEALIRIAERAGVSPSTMIDRIIGKVVDDGEEVALRRLGRLAQPKKDEQV